MSTNHGLRGGALQKGARLVVEARAEEVVRRGVADVEPDARLEAHQLDEVVRRERTGLRRRCRRQRLGAERVHRAHRSDAQLIGSGTRLDLVAREADVAEEELRRAAARLAHEADANGAGVGDELGLATLGERRDAERGVHEVQLSLVLGDDAPRGALAVLAEQAEPARGWRSGRGAGRQLDGRRASGRSGRDGSTGACQERECAEQAGRGEAARSRAPPGAGGMASAPWSREHTVSAIVPIQFKTSGCLFSIVASIVLTIVLNLLLRACA